MKNLLVALSLSFFVIQFNEVFAQCSTPNTSPITGSTSACETLTPPGVSIPYYVTSTQGSTYNWSVSGGTITGGGTTSSIMVRWGVAGAGNVSVQERNSGGCFGAVVNLPVTIVASPTVSAPSSSMCKGATMQLSPATGGTWTYYFSNFLPPPSVTSSGLVTIPNFSGALNPSASFKFTSSSAPGCSNTVTIAINPSPSTSTITGVNTVLANTNGVPYSVTNTPGSSYVWNITDGSQATGGNTNAITVNWGSVGSGNVSVTETNSSQCAGLAVNLPVTVNNLPTSPITGSTSVCAGTHDVPYSVTNTSGSSYSWSITGGGIQASGGNTSSITVNWGATGGTVSVVETNSAGTQGQPVNLPVTVKPSPSASTIAGTTMVCAGATNGVTYSVTSGAGSTYAWSVNGGNVASGGNSSLITVNWTATGSGNVSVVETNTVGCSGPTINLPVTVSTLTAPAVSSPSSSMNWGTTMQLSPSSGGSWASQTPSGLYSVTSSGLITSGNFNGLMAPGTFVFTQSSTGCTNTLAINFGGCQPPSTSSITGSTTVCMNSKGVPYSVTNRSGSTYVWSIQNGTQATGGSTSSITVDWQNAATGTVSVTETNSGCSGSTVSLPVTMQGTNVFADYSNICPGASTQLTPATGGTWSQIAPIYPQGPTLTSSSRVTAPSTVSAPTTSTFLFTHSSGCTNSLSITAYPAPTPSITGSTSLCANAATGVPYSVTNTPGSTYVWQIPMGTQATGGNTNNITVNWDPTALGPNDVYVTETNVAGCSGSSSLPVTINSGPIATAIVGPSTVCNNTTTYRVDNPQGGSTYAWSAVGGTTSAGGNYYDINVNWGTAQPGTAVSVKETTSAGCTGPTLNLPVTISARPITSAITGPASVCPGATGVAYSVTNTSGNSYTWYVQGGTQASGGSTNAITVDWGSSLSSAYISVTETSPVGCQSVGSSLTITPSTTIITSQPYYNVQTFCAGANITPLSVGATGSSLSYQWYRNSTNSNSGGTPIVGANTSTYTPQNTVAGTTYYYVVVSGSCGTVVSYVSGIIINPTTVITTQPPATLQSSCLNGSFGALSSFAAAGTNLTYQWYSNTISQNSGGTPYSTISNPWLPSSSVGTTYYYVVVSGSCGTVTSNISGPMTVYPNTAITAQPSTTLQTVCQNGAVTPLTVGAVGGALNYQWHSGDYGGPSVSGATASTFAPSTTLAGGNKYYVVVTGACGAAATSDYSGFVIINPATSITSQPSTATQTVCQAGNPTILSVTAGGTGPFTYQWYSNSTNSNTGGSAISNTNSSTFTPLTSVAGVSYYYVVVSGACGSKTSNVSGSVTVTPSVTITSQPSGAQQSICPNAATTSLAVAAAGTSPISYQWYSNNSNSNVGGTAIGGATLASYKPSSATVGTLYYYAVVSSACGTATSNVSGAIIVNSPLTITGDPADVAVCQNGTIQPLVTATAGGTGTLHYQWYSNTSAANSGGSTIAGATTSSLPLSSATPGRYYYYLVVSDLCVSVTSRVATVDVGTPLSATSSLSPASQTVCQFGTITPLTIAPTSGAVNYVWYKNTVSSNTGGTWMASTSSPSYTPDNSVSGVGYYYVVPANGCGNATSSSVASVTVRSNSFISAQSSPVVAVCQSGPATLTVTPSANSPVGYQWYSNNTTSYLGTAINGANSDHYTAPTGTVGTTYYYVTVTGQNQCPINSGLFTVMVSTPLSIASQPSLTPQTICQNGTATALSFSPSSTGGYYQWYRNTGNSNTGGTAIVGATATSYTPQTSSANPYYYYATATNSCGTVSTNVSGLVTVNAAPSITSQPVSQAACLNGAATLSVTATGNGTPTYQWYSNTSNSYTGIAVGGATLASYSPPTSSVGTNYYYVLVKDAGSCSTLSSISAVNVNSTLSITSQPQLTTQTVCQNGSASALSVSINASGPSSYQWYSNTNNSNTGGTLVTGATSSSYTPSTAAAGTFYYYALITNACGSVTSNVSGPVTINPQPTITLQPISPPSVCQNGVLNNLTVAATGAGPLSYQWYVNNTNSNSGGAPISSATATSFAPSSTLTGTFYYYVVVSGACGSATSNVSIVDINAPISITGLYNWGQQVCQNGATGTLSPTGVNVSGGILGYQWYTNSANSNIGGTLASGATSSTYTPSTATTGISYYYVVATNQCSSVVSQPMSVTIWTKPVITTQPSPLNQTVCPGGPIAPLTVAATSSSQPNNYYQWYFPWYSPGYHNTSGGYIPGATSPTYTPSNTMTGTNHYQAAVINVCGTTYSNDSGAITVNPSPTVSVPSSRLCIGLTMTLSPTSGGTWVSNNPAVASVTNAGVVTGVATGSVTFTFTDATTTCSNTTTAVTVNANPTVSAPSSSLCVGLTMTLSPTSGGTWVSSNPTVASVTNAGVVTGVAAGNATFTFTSTATGCNSTTSAVTINANPTVSVPSSSLCMGLAMTLSPTSGGTWVSNNPAVASVTNAGLVTPLSAGSVTFTFTNTSTTCSNTTSAVTINAKPVVSVPLSNLCVGSTMTLSPTSGGTWASSNPAIASVTNAGLVTGLAAGSVTFTFTSTSTTCANTTASVTVSALPYLTIDGGTTTICQGGTIQLTATTDNLQSNYTWSTGATSSSINVASSGTYSVTITNPGSICPATASKSVSILPNTGGGSITSSGGCADGSHPVTLSTSPAGTNYQWSTGATTSSISTSLICQVTYFQVSYLINGNPASACFAVSPCAYCRIAADHSADGSIDSPQSPTRELDPSTVKEMTAYPNPAADVVTIAMPWNAKEDTRVVMYDMFGKPLVNGILKKGEWKTDLSVRDCAQGLYLVNVGNGDLINSIKVMVVRK